MKARPVPAVTPLRQLRSNSYDPDSHCRLSLIALLLMLHSRKDNRTREATEGRLHGRDAEEILGSGDSWPARAYQIPWLASAKKESPDPVARPLLVVSHHAGQLICSHWRAALGMAEPGVPDSRRPGWEAIARRCIRQRTRGRGRHHHRGS